MNSTPDIAKNNILSNPSAKTVIDQNIERKITRTCFQNTGLGHYFKGLLSFEVVDRKRREPYEDKKQRCSPPQACGLYSTEDRRCLSPKRKIKQFATHSRSIQNFCGIANTNIYCKN